MDPFRRCNSRCGVPDGRRASSVSISRRPLGVRQRVASDVRAHVAGQGRVDHLVEVDALVEWDIVEVALKSAIADLSKMRENEGRALRKDLLENLRETRRVLPEIQAASTGLNERLRQKLETRIRRLVTERVDPHRIVQEAALVADKADVAEELARLKSHCEQFTEALDGKDPVGRRLDFLLQEMNREVNTIGSKAAEHPISRRVVHLKSILERMREQAANVE